MTGYPTEEPVVHPGSPPPPVFTEVLPAAPGQPPAAIRWTPDRTPGRGTLTVQTPAGRCCCTYRVAEFLTPWNGRAVRMTKDGGQAGSDPEAGGYDVFLGRNGQDRRCECRGFLRWGRCKHLAALETLLSNGWLDLELVNPDADVGATEPVENQPEPEELARREVVGRVRELAGYPAVTDPAPALAWLASPAAAGLLAAIGWEAMPAGRVVALLTGYPF